MSTTEQITGGASAAVRLPRGVQRITVPLPFRPREVHAYLVELEGCEWMLVDGGIDSEAAWQVLHAAVRQVTAGWHRVRLNLITHMHMDHVGLARRVRDASGASLAMGALDVQRYAHAAVHPEEEAAYRANLFREAGAPGDLVAALAGGTAQPQAPLQVEHRLDGEDGDVPGAPGWRWLWTPGHTAGHVSLLRPEDGVLIAGDAVLPRITPTIGVNRQRPDPVGDYLQTLDRLEALAPGVVFGGHGEPIPNTIERLGELRVATQGESERVLELLRAGSGSAWEIAARRYPKRELPPAAWAQATRETLAHLQHLVASQTARVERGPDPVLHFGVA